jgi:hypothetical protein
MVIFLRAPGHPFRAVSNFYAEISATGVNDTADKLFTGVKDTGDKL